MSEAQYSTGAVMCRSRTACVHVQQLRIRRNFRPSGAKISLGAPLSRNWYKLARMELLSPGIYLGIFGALDLFRVLGYVLLWREVVVEWCDAMNWRLGSSMENLQNYGFRFGVFTLLFLCFVQDANSKVGHQRISGTLTWFNNFVALSSHAIAVWVRLRILLEPICRGVLSLGDHSIELTGEITEEITLSTARTKLSLNQICFPFKDQWP